MHRQAGVALAGFATGLGLALGSLTAVAESEVLVFDNPEGAGAGRTYTREEIQAAAPMPWTSPPAVLVSPPAAPAVRAATSAQPLVTIPPTRPQRDAQRQAELDFPDQWGLLRGAAVSQGETLLDCQVEKSAVSNLIDQRRHPCTSYRGNDDRGQALDYPWKTIGKLIMTDHNGTLYTGTAQVISQTLPGGRSLVITAAHNVWDPDANQPNAKITFVPAEWDGVAPFGQFDYDQAFLLKRYTDDPGASDNNRYDVALLTLKRNEAGRRVDDYTGTLGLRWNVPYVMNIMQFGYAGAGEFGDRFTTAVTGQTFRHTFKSEQHCFPSPTENILFVGSPMTKGASGGAWIESFRPYFAESGNYVVSVVSSGVACADAQSPPGFNNITNIQTGPRFTDDNIGRLCARAGCSSSVAN